MIPPAAGVPTGGAPPVNYTPSVAAPAVTSLSGAVAFLQGKLVTALTALLQGGAAAPARIGTPPPALPPYSGPDAALLQLQRETILLAIEALGTAPAQTAAPAP